MTCKDCRNALYCIYLNDDSDGMEMICLNFVPKVKHEKIIRRT